MLERVERREIKQSHSINDIYNLYKEELHWRILNHPSFPELKKKVDSSNKRCGIKDSHVDLTRYLTHVEFNNKSALSQKILSLQNSIMISSGIPRAYSNWRGDVINWTHIKDNGLPEAIISDYPM